MYVAVYGVYGNKGSEQTEKRQVLAIHPPRQRAHARQEIPNLVSWK